MSAIIYSLFKKRENLAIRCPHCNERVIAHLHPDMVYCFSCDQILKAKAA